MNIFKKPKSVLTYNYPHLLGFKNAIRHSYWLEDEYNFTNDISDFFTQVSDSERESIKRTMLAIAQIEVAVKTFWGDLYHHIPANEIGDVGATFADSEVRHKDAYKSLLEKLGLLNDLDTIADVPAIKGRIEYLNKYLKYKDSKDKKLYTKTILLFSMFIEHVSLFSQFLIIMSFNKYKNLFKGMSNVVEATSKEEDVHGNFGAALINIIKKENPEWFDEALDKEIRDAAIKAYDAESGILNWIFEEGELDFLSVDTIKNFIADRFNKSMNMIGMGKIFDVDTDLLESISWFDVELTSSKEGDFFYKKQVDYNKRSQSSTADDLF